MLERSLIKVDRRKATRSGTLRARQRIVNFFVLSGADGAWKECVWSETLGQCFSPSALPLICLAGRCGRVLRGSSSNCMGNCIDSNQCSHCLSSYNCGWCGKYGTTGEGECFEGGLQGQSDNWCSFKISCPSGNSRIWLDGYSTLMAEDTVFNGW